ncbi:MAG: AAA family ATPase [Lachnospiraceae bacterium]|nr:AAA family ATPase [Lachnospiraceae bacterium]
MIFYRIDGGAESIIGVECFKDDHNRNEIREAARHLGIKGEAFNLGFKGKVHAFVSEITGTVVTAGMILHSAQDPQKLVHAFMESVGICLKEFRCEETTFGNLLNMLVAGERRDFVRDPDEVLRKFDLSLLNDHFGHGVDFEEDLIEECGKNSVYESAGAIISNETLLEELDRIYEGKKGKGAVKGHPVHYMLLTDSRRDHEDIGRILLQALHANGRIANRRSCTMNISIGRRGPQNKAYDSLYRSCIGGAVQIFFLHECDEEEEDGFASAQREYLEALSEVIRRYRNKVLTLISLSAKNRKAESLLREYLENMTFLEVKEEAVPRERAMTYFRDLAKEYGVKTDRRIEALLEQEDGYYAQDLQRIFDEWYDVKLKKSRYPQYSAMEIYRKSERKKKAAGTAYEELMEMCGIDEAKKLINTAINCRRAQKYFAGAGVGEEKFSMHMVFSGNPGTAKTTVARLFAKILKENGLVETGAFIEAGRGDLVGKYVGWTAKIIQKKFRDAAGGVLFIDEAYSLLDDRSGSFGDEAINTIVQELENHREDVITIFAGYPDRMEEFLERNPGLRSRIAFHVPFPDYDTAQLCEIAELTAGRMGLRFAEDARGRLREIFEAARRTRNFGNGRYVRNVVEKARMKQMTRLFDAGYEIISKGELGTLAAEDIEMPERKESEKVRIGFASV